MRFTAILFTVLAAASTVTFAAPVPTPIATSLQAPVAAAVAVATPAHLTVPAATPIPPVQDLQNRSLWGRIKKAASGAAHFVSKAANKVKSVYNTASNVWKSASGAFKSASDAYKQVAPLVKAIHKRDDEFDEQLHRRDELEFEEELHRRDEMEVEEQLYRRHVENTQSEDAPVVPAVHKVSGRARHARHHRD